MFSSNSYYSFLSRAINLPRKAKQTNSKAKLKPLSPRREAKSPGWTPRKEDILPGKRKLYSIFVEDPKLRSHPEKDLEAGDLELIPIAEEQPIRLYPASLIGGGVLSKMEQKFTSPALIPKASEETETIPSDICTRQVSSVAPSSQEDVSSEDLPISKYHELKFKFLVQDPILQGLQGVVRRWKAGQILGNGRMGNVIKAMDVCSGEIFAVKRLFFDPKNEGQKSSVQGLEKEVQMLKELTHPNIVKFLGSETIGESLCIYLEYLPGKSLSSLIGTIGPLSEGLVKIYLRDVICGLKYLHEKKVVHRDVKGSNLLLDEEGRVKLADFGCSAQLDTSCSHSDILTSLKGSLPWMAPEVIQQIGYGRKADIWSLGCVAIELLSGKPPWQDFENQLQAVVRIGLSADLPDVPAHISPEAKDFIYQCLRRNPKQRAKASDLEFHPFLISA